MCARLARLFAYNDHLNVMNRCNYVLGVQKNDFVLIQSSAVPSRRRGCTESKITVFNQLPLLYIYSSHRRTVKAICEPSATYLQ